jgi:AcrR family transcriptional regulator
MAAIGNRQPPNGPLAGLVAAASPQAGAGHRERLVLGMAAAVAERGYAATTITDVVRHARVSRRTFYEHFADKEACFLAAYDAVSDSLLAAIADATSGAATWEARILAGVHAYLRALAAEPAVARVFIVEILSAGAPALARRRVVLGRFAAHVQAQVDDARAAGAPVAPLGDAAALALVGGIHESVLAALEDGGDEALLALEDDLTGVVSAVLLRPAG